MARFRQVLDVEIQAVDGLPLAATLFAPAAPAAASVLLLPATGVRRRFYGPFADFLATRGFRVLTLDYRGVGGSRPERLRGFPASLSAWAELDADSALRHLAERFPQEPLLGVGHSFGGQAFGLLDGRRRFGAALLVAAQSGWWGHWHGPARLRLIAFWYLVIPAATALCGYLPGRRLGLGEDLPAGVARQWARWGRHPDYLLRGDAGGLAARYADIDCPLLALSFADDGYAPRPAVAALLALYRGAAVEHRHFDEAAGVGHFGFFRESARHTLWPEAARWLEARVASAFRAGKSR